LIIDAPRLVEPCPEHQKAAGSDNLRASELVLSAFFIVSLGGPPPQQDVDTSPIIALQKKEMVMPERSNVVPVHCLDRLERAKSRAMEIRPPARAMGKRHPLPLPSGTHRSGGLVSPGSPGGG
jgi:hypothetical protein